MTQNGDRDMIAPDIAGIILAAGLGLRLDPSGASCKPAQPLADGTPLLRAAFDALQTQVASITVVGGKHRRQLATLLQGLPANLVYCPRAEDGLGASLRCGLEQTPAQTGWIIMLADMPFVAPATIAQVVARLHDGARIVRPSYQGKPGHPVGFASDMRAALLNAPPDDGARWLIRRNPDWLTTIAVDDPGCVIDIDTPEDLARYDRASRPA